MPTRAIVLAGWISVKAAPFAYRRPGSLDEVCALLAAEEDARVIAGGQTLVPMMAMRLARPTLLVDILRLPGLAGIREEGDAIVIGATTRQAAAEKNALVGDKLPLLAKALPWIGHAPTRSRGTVGGSLAHADPAAEIPLVAQTLRADIYVQTSTTSTTLQADEFFLGPMITALQPGACLTAVRLPVWKHKRIGVGFHEVNARRSDFAFVAAAAQVALDEGGRCVACAIGLGGVVDHPIRLDAAAEGLIGTSLADSAIADALAAETAQLEAMSDLHASAGYRRRVAAALARRALIDARNEAAARRP
jgi:CO/xanthine dehydrogenase FAD-binding subunit